MQGGIHPDFSGDTYLRILTAAKEAAPGVHVHAFSPLEVHHGATTADSGYERCEEEQAGTGRWGQTETRGRPMQVDINTGLRTGTRKRVGAGPEPPQPHPHVEQQPEWLYRICRG